MRIALLAVFCLATSLALGQGKPPEYPEVAKAMKETAFLVGEWEGEGWFLVNGKKEVSKVTEKIALKAGGTVMSLEGRGVNPEGKEIHNAYGFLFYDRETKGYRMRSFLTTGATGEHDATAKDGVIVWAIKSQRTIRYTIKLDEQGRWFEIGEVDMGDGKWFQFFEMRLKKIK